MLYFLEHMLFSYIPTPTIFSGGVRGSHPSHLLLRDTINWAADALLERKCLTA